MRLRTVLAALAATLLLAAPAGAADPIPGALYEGTTEDGNPFQFRVAPDGQTLTDLVTSSSVTCVGSQGGVEISALASKTPFTITEGTVTGEDEAALPRLTLAGTFTSPAEAAGTLRASFAKFDYSGGGLTTCMRELTWTARTAAPAPARTPGPAGPPEPVGQVDSGPTAGPAPAPAPSSTAAGPAVGIRFPSGVRLRPSLSNGWIVGGTVAAPATLKGKVTLGARDARRYGLGRKAVVVARTTEVVAAAGEFGLEFKPSRRIARKLRRARRLTFALAVEAIGADGGRSVTKRSITLGP